MLTQDISIEQLGPKMRAYAFEHRWEPSLLTPTHEQLSEFSNECRISETGEIIDIHCTMTPVNDPQSLCWFVLVSACNVDHKTQISQWAVAKIRCSFFHPEETVHILPLDDRIAFAQSQGYGGKILENNVIFMTLNRVRS